MLWFQEWNILSSTHRYTWVRKPRWGREGKGRGGDEVRYSGKDEGKEKTAWGGSLQHKTSGQYTSTPDCGFQITITESRQSVLTEHPSWRTTVVYPDHHSVTSERDVPQHQYHCPPFRHVSDIPAEEVMLHQHVLDPIPEGSEGVWLLGQLPVAGQTEGELAHQPAMVGAGSGAPVSRFDWVHG